MRILITYFSILFCFPQQSFQRMKIKTIDSMSINIVFIQIQNTSIQNSTTFPISYRYFFFGERDIYIYFWKRSKHMPFGHRNFSTVLWILFYFLFFLILYVLFCSVHSFISDIDFDQEILNLFDFLLYFSFHSFSLVLFRSQRCQNIRINSLNLELFYISILPIMLTREANVIILILLN